MTLNCSADNLIHERDQAEEYKRLHLHQLRDRIKRLHGPAYKGGGPQAMETHGYDPENTYYQYTSLMNPRLAQEPFEVRLSTRRPAAQELVSRALRHAISRWVRDTQYQDLREQVATDFNVAWGVMMTTLGPAPGYEENDDPVLWPHVSRISPFDFGWDPLAKSPQMCRYMYHRVVEDKSTLIERAKAGTESGWNLDVIERLGINKIDDRNDPDHEIAIDRKEVAYDIFWVSEKELDSFPDDREGKPSRDQGYNGTLYYVAQTQEGSDQEGKRGVYVREPQPYYGPRWGPYSWFGGMYISDEAAPIAPLVALETQIRELNALVRAINRSDRSYKRLVLVDSSHPKLAQIIKGSPHDFVIPVRGLNTDQVIQLEVGGSTQMMHAGAQNSRMLLERGLGMDDALRGYVSGEGTATEHSIAAEMGALRITFPVQRYRRGELQAIKTVAWYLYHTDEVVVPLDAQASEELGIDAPLFLGGGLEGEGSGASFDDLGIEIHVVPEGLEQRRQMELLNLLPQLLPAIVSFPFARWPEYLDTVGQINRMPELSRFIDWNAAREMAGMMIEQGAMTGLQGDQPRITRDLGGSGIVRHAVSASRGPGQGEPSAAPAAGGGQTPKQLSATGA